MRYAILTGDAYVLAMAPVVRTKLLEVGVAHLRPQTTSISPVMKMRTERHHEELISHLLMYITWGVRTILGLPALET